MKTETVRAKLRGEERFFSCRYPFTYKGWKIEEGQVLGPLTEEVWLELAGPKYYRYGQCGGGMVKVQEMEDGFHKITFTGTQYVEGERFYRVKFLKPTTFIPEGYCCRLRLSDIRNFSTRVRYQNDAPLPAHHQSELTLILLEDRPRPDITPEEAKERAESIQAGLAEQSRPSWLGPVTATPLIPKV